LRKFRVNACHVAEKTHARPRVANPCSAPGQDAFCITGIEFVTPDHAEHWVILVLINLIVSYLGNHMAADLLPNGRSFASDPRVARQRASVVVRIVTELRDNGLYRTDDLLLRAIQSQLLGAVTELLACAEGHVVYATPKTR
jgi:hypothetical protein